MDDFERLLREEISRSCERGLESMTIIASALDTSGKIRALDIEAMTAMYRCLAETTALFRFYNAHFNNADLQAQEKKMQSRMMHVEKSINTFYKMILGS